MKKYLISVMFLLIGSILNAQEEEIIMVVSKYNNNTIEQSGFIDQNGKKDSTWTLYNETGGIIGVGSYSHGVKEGYWYSYNDNGDKIFEVLYVNGEKRKGKLCLNKSSYLKDSRLLRIASFTLNGQISLHKNRHFYFGAINLRLPNN